MSQDAAGQLLLTLFLLLPMACLGALLRIPLGNLTILEESILAITFHLVELATDLLQGAQLGFKVNIVATASLHLLDQVVVVLLVLGCCLTSSLSSSGFFLCCKTKLRLG